MSGPSRRPPLVGREAELAFLLQLLVRAGEGEGGVALVAGEPGIGKTRLLAELATRARAEGWTVLAGRAYETAGMPPYLPFAEALREYIRSCPPERLRDALGRGAADVARLVPEVRDALPELPAPAVTSPEGDRYRLFDSVASFLLAIARAPDHAGLVLLLDDLHWADTSTLLLLEHLARRLPDSRLLLVAAHRSMEAEIGRSLADLLAGLRRERLAETVLLRPLAPEETAVLVAGMAMATPAPVVAAAIHRRTEGNPFFVEEVVQQLRGEGRDLADAATATAEWRAPEGVRQVIGARLARLGADTRRLLAAAAVLGDTAPVDLLGAMTGMMPSLLLDTLDEATRAGMLRERGDAYQFAHALTRQTVADSIGLGRRQALHRAAAEAIESLRRTNVQRHVAALALHYQLAGPAVDPLTTVRYLLLAAETAAAASAWEAAAAHYDAALALLPSGDDERRCVLLLGLGETQQNAGDSQDAQQAFRDAANLARHTADPEHLARAALGFALTVIVPLGPLQQAAAALLQDALEALDEGDSPLRARTLAQLAWMQQFTIPWAQWGALSNRAVAMARRLSDLPTLAFVLIQHHWALARADGGALDERRALIAEVLALAEQIGDLVFVHDTYQFQVVAALEVGDAAAAERAITEYEAVAQRFRTAFTTERALQLRAMQEMMVGRLAAAEDLIGQAAALAERMQSPGALRVGVITFQLMYLHLYQGRAGAVAAGMMGEGPAPGPLPLGEGPAPGPLPLGVSIQLGDPYLSIHPRSRRGYFLARAGRLAEARADFEQVAARDFTDLHHIFDEVLILAHLAETCALLGDTRRAMLLYRRLLPVRTRGVATANGTVFHGAVAHYLGLLAATRLRVGRSAPAAVGVEGPPVDEPAAGDEVDWETAVGHFEAALGLHARMGAQIWVAQTQCAYAALLWDRRQPQDLRRARELLEQAATTFTTLGLAHAVEAHQVLTPPPGGAAPAGGPPLPYGLSAREADVLRLLAAGNTSREIADALVLSVRTVDRHISNIYAKIGTRNKAEAVAYAVRSGLATAAASRHG